MLELYRCFCLIFPASYFFSEGTQSFYFTLLVLNLDQIELVQLSSPNSIDFYFVTSRFFVITRCFSFLSLCSVCTVRSCCGTAVTLRGDVIYIHTHTGKDLATVS